MNKIVKLIFHGYKPSKIDIEKFTDSTQFNYALKNSVFDRIDL